MPGFIVYGAFIYHPYSWIAAAAISLGLLLLIPYRTAAAAAKQADVLAPIIYTL